ncbi:MAG: polysaccharide biosynthesis C-terminal domain-containing protein [Raineya sp.]|jgi:O-antigen/teichoic acid export membrane protein|nr:polysaccharide biosynthesis C-terminal domain-containing protein [Raineya sp.]
MGIVVRQSLKASFVSYIGVGLGLINNLFVSTQILNPEQLAINRLLLENSLVFACFAHLGTPFILDRFFVHFKDQEKKHSGFLGFLLLISLVGVGIFSLIYIAFREPIADYFRLKSPQIIDYHFFSLPLTAFWVYIIVFEGYSRNNSRIAIPAAIREIFLKGFNMGIILIYGLGWIGFDYVIYGMVLMYLLAVIILVLYIKNLKKLFLGIGWNIFKGEYFKPMIIYGFFIILGGLGENVFKFVDRVMLAGQEGLAESAIFILATFIVTTIEIPKKALSQISIPILSEAIQTNNRGKLNEIYHKVALNQLMGGAFVFLGIWCCIDELFMIIPRGAIYSEGKWVVFFLGLATLFNLASGLRGEVITYSHKYYISSIFVFIFALVNIVLNHWLIDLYKIDGAAYATTISSILYITTQVFYVYRKFGILPYQRKQIYIVIVALIIWAMMLLLPKADNMWQALFILSLKALIITVLYFISILKLKVSPELNNLYKMGLNFLYKKLGK